MKHSRKKNYVLQKHIAFVRSSALKRFIVILLPKKFSPCFKLTSANCIEIEIDKKYLHSVAAGEKNEHINCILTFLKASLQIRH